MWCVDALVKLWSVFSEIDYSIWASCSIAPYVVVVNLVARDTLLYYELIGAIGGCHPEFRFESHKTFRSNQEGKGNLRQ